MKEKKKVVHLIVLYVLVIALALWLLSLSGSQADGDNWACIQQTCSASEPAGEAWAAENCGTVEVNGSQVEACRVVINGQEQVIPRNAINLSAIQSCTEYTCVQEVRVREVNYTFEPNQTQTVQQ